MKRSPMTRKTPMRRTRLDRLERHADGTPRFQTPGEAIKAGAIRADMSRAQLKAHSAPAKRSGLPRTTSLRAQQRRQYNRLKPGYLEAHPYCQITIAILGLDEADVIKHHGAYGKPQFGTKGERPARIYHVSRANQLHHRNKANGIRLIDFNYIMSACDAAHDWTEKKKDQARAIGVLCPINCRPDGTMPDGTKQPTTTELLTQRHTEKTK